MSDDARVIAELAAVSDADACHTILHYIYVPSSEAAAAVADELRHHGFHTESRLGADDVNWLVFARQKAVPSNALLATTRRLLETVVAKFGGEYDGWEAEVVSQLRSSSSH
jgi:hypothetical protein